MQVGIWHTALAAAHGGPTYDNHEPGNREPAEEIPDHRVQGEHAVGGNLGHHNLLAGGEDIGGGQDPTVRVGRNGQTQLMVMAGQLDAVFDCPEDRLLGTHLG